ncbi:MAG: hypothetical protein ACLTZM_26675 [Ruminococcus sp.]
MYLFLAGKVEKGGFYADLFCNDSSEGNIFKERICAAALGVESGSPHDRMKGVRWQEEQRLLAVEDLPEKRIIAARFQKTDSYGMIWTSDLVLNLEEKRLSVGLDQEVTEQTSSFFYRFSPHILSDW